MRCVGGGIKELRIAPELFRPGIPSDRYARLALPHTFGEEP